MRIYYKIFDAPGYEKYPLIIFEDKKYVGLEDLLNTKGSAITLEKILEKIVLVEENKSEFEEIGNERNMLEIKKDECIIYDLFAGMLDDDELNPTIYMSLSELKIVVVEWIQKKEEMCKMLE